MKALWGLPILLTVTSISAGIFILSGAIARQRGAAPRPIIGGAMLCSRALAGSYFISRPTVR